MAKKLYVGGLSFKTTQESLNAYFAQVGLVESAMIIMDRETGRSKGFGFVEMANDDDAQKAIDFANGKDFEGRSLTVNEARPQKDFGDRPRGGLGVGDRRPRFGSDRGPRNDAPRQGGGSDW